MDGRGRIRISDVEAVRERTDIVKLISEYVPLKKSGREFRGPCPFHQEKDPSFYVNPAKGVYYCFGCQASGGVFNFLMQLEGISFTESVERLADRIGYRLSYEEASPEDEERRKVRERLFRLNQTACDYFHHLLLNTPEGENARTYLKRRSFDQDTIKNFKLGYAPHGWEATSTFLKRKGFSEKELIAAGLAREREGGRAGVYDLFRNRIIFPIFDARGRIIAFGGRRLDEKAESEPKYINSPETPIYRKGRTLYGFYQSRQFIQDSNVAIVVEGYTDLIALWQAGVKNVVATLGTALTTSHFELIARFASKVYLAFDSDRAGVEAALRPLELVNRVSLDMLVVLMPEGEDPASLVESGGAKAFGEVLAKAEPLVEFAAAKTIERHNLSSPMGRRKAMEDCIPILLKVSAPEMRPVFNDLVRRIGTLLDMPADTVKVFLREAQDRRGYGTADVQRVRAPLMWEKIEREALRVLLHDPEKLIEYQFMDPEYFHDEGNRKIFEMLKEIALRDEETLIAEYEKIVGGLVEEITDEQMRKHYVKLLMEPPPSSEPGIEDKVFDRLAYAYFKREKRKVEEELRNCDKKLEPKRYDELFRRLVEYDRVIKEQFPFDHR